MQRPGHAAAHPQGHTGWWLQPDGSWEAKKGERRPKVSPTQSSCTAYACSPNSPQLWDLGLGITTAYLLCDPGKAPIPLWVSALAFHGTGKTRGHTRKPNDPLVPSVYRRV